MKHKMPIWVKKAMVFLFLFTFLIFVACGPDGDISSDNGNPTGIYQASLVFPPEVPRVEPEKISSSKLINDGIDCAELGIVTLTFSFFSSNDDPIANGTFACQDHQAVITAIPAGSGITLEVTAENQSGMALLRGEEREITIVANQTTQGDDITLYPTNSPTVAAGDEPKTLVFDWEHIQFPGHVNHYQLQVDPDGDSGFDTVEGADFIIDTNHELTIPVHLTDWINAVYRVAAWDTDDNVVATSSEIDLLTTVSSEEVIGYVKASNTDADDLFGGAVALSADDNTLAVGADFEESAGAVYVFTRISGIWRQQAYIKASNTDAGDRFGDAVALSADGNTLAVGADNEDSAAGGIGGNENDNSMASAGTVYVFRRDSDTWRQQAYVKASNTNGSDWFGDAVALSADGDTLAVGAFGEDSASRGINGNENDNSMGWSGAVYVFIRNSGTWQQQAYVKASNTDADDMFGDAVALSADGNTLAVGASGESSAARGIGGDETDNSMDYAGAVYVFRRDSGTWRQQAYVKASNTGNTGADDTGEINSGEFGEAVALSFDGNTLAVGARYEESAARGIDGNENDSSMDDAGAVYVFRRDSDTWRQQAYVKASNTDTHDLFGSAVALSADGNTLVVGAEGEASAARGINGNGNDNTMPDAGAIYVFRRSNGIWQQQAYVKASNTYADDMFGNAATLSADGNTMAVGAWGEASAAKGIGGNEDDNGMDNAGAVYLY